MIKPGKVALILSMLLVVLVAGCTGQSSSVPSGKATASPSCTSNWQCGEWNTCSAAGTQTRICGDENNCGTATGKPSVSQDCTKTCASNWQCSSWSDCSSSGTQTRTCTDANNCGTTAGKPSDGQSCAYTPPAPPPESAVLKGAPSIQESGIENFFYVIGEIENTGTKSYKNYQLGIVVSLYSGSQIVATCHGFAQTDLGPGETTTYQAICANAPAYDSYKVKLQIS